MTDPSMANHGLNGLDSKINDRGFFERILRERDKTDAEREKRLDERFESQEKAVSYALTSAEKAVNAALAAADKAVEKAEETQKATLHAHNGLIKQMQERDGTYATKTDIDNLSEKIGELRSRLDVGPPALANLQSQADTAAGRSAGVQVTIGHLFAAVGASSALVGIVTYIGTH